MELALAGVALGLAIVAVVFTVPLRRKVADLKAGLHASNRALASAEAALADQVSAAEKGTLRATVEIRTDFEARVASMASEASETADGLSAQIGAAQDEIMRALDALRSRQESDNSAVVAEVAEMIDHQTEFLRSDLEARIAQREG